MRNGFPAGTRVCTRTKNGKSGFNPIEDIEVGMYVYTHQFRWKRVTAVGSALDHTIILRDYDDTSLECTPDQRILTISGTLIDYIPQQSDLTLEQRMRVLYPFYKYSDIEMRSDGGLVIQWIPACEAVERNGYSWLTIIPDEEYAWWRPIESIVEPHELKQVFWLEVEDDHSFIADYKAVRDNTDIGIAERSYDEKNPKVHSTAVPVYADSTSNRTWTGLKQCSM